MRSAKTVAPNYQALTTSAGLRVVYRHTDAPVCYCGFMFDCGTRHEAGPTQYGMAHFIEHILFKGTQKRDSWHINNRMESVGGELNAFTTKEETTFYSAFLYHDYERAIELLCDLVCHPTAPEKELVKEQEVVIDEIMSYRDTPAELIYDEFENALYAGNSLGHNILGSEETVRSFHSEACLSFIRQHYTTSRSLFFFQGNIPLDRIVKTLEKWYEVRPDLECPKQNEEVVPATLTPANAEPDTTEVNHNQAHVILGAPAYHIGHPNSAALALLNNILGGPGMNSKLNLALREQRGLVYTVESNINNYTDAGYFSIYFGCDHEDVSKCLKLCHTQLDHFRNVEMTPTQLAAAQRQLRGQLGVSQANLENNAISLAKNMLRLGRVESLEETCARIDAVTPLQVQQVANEVFDNARLRTTIIQ